MTEIKRPQVGKASAITTLSFGLLVAPEVKLFKATDDKDPELAQFTGTAGPRGGRIEDRYREVGESQGSTGGVGKVTITKKGSPKPEEAVWSEPEAGEREKYIVEVVDDTEVEIDREEIRRGLWDGDTFIDCTEQLAEIEDATKMEDMAVESFIRTQNIPRERIVASYFVTPQNKYGLRVLALLHAALRKSSHAAIVRWTARSRQSLGVLIAHPQGGLILQKLVWVEKARLAPELSQEVAKLARSAPEEEVDATVGLIEQMAERGRAHLDELRDPAVVYREELQAVALTHKPELWGIKEKQADPEELELAELINASAKRLAS